MRHIITILALIILTNSTFGQKIYQAQREAYKTNKFVYELYLFNDSTCFLKGHYLDNSTYFIFKGYLYHKTDTLFDFHYQPLINLSCNKRFRIKDSIRISINLIDTVMPSMIFKIGKKGEIWQDIKLSDLRTKIYKKDIDKMDFWIDSKFSDPITGERIIMTVPETSEPELSYFGSDTDFITTKVSMNNGELTLYPDNLYILNKDKMILVK